MYADRLPPAQQLFVTRTTRRPSSPLHPAILCPPPVRENNMATMRERRRKKKEEREKQPPSSAVSPSSGGEASALRELKETAAAQAEEIARLRRELGEQKQKQKQPPRGRGGGGGTSHGGGHGGGGEEDALAYLGRPFGALAARRVGWLAVFLCSLSLTAFIMNGFEHTLSRQIELAYFVPLLAGHGGNTGGQTVGAVLSALASGEVGPGDALRVVRKECLAGLAVGCLLGPAVGAVVHWGMGISSHVTAVLAVTIPLLSTIAATLAGTVPFACLALGLDPAVIAAPAMTSFVDVTGLMCYFLIANRVFRLWGLEL